MKESLYLKTNCGCLYPKLLHTKSQKKGTKRWHKMCLSDNKDEKILYASDDLRIEAALEYLACQLLLMSNG